MTAGFHQRVNELLRANNADGPCMLSLVCTIQGLTLASAGDGESDEHVAAFAALFDDIVHRAVRDLAFRRVEEVTLVDPGRGRYVVRPLVVHGRVAFFLVVRAETHVSWRRNTARLCARLERELESHAPSDAEVA